MVLYHDLGLTGNGQGFHASLVVQADGNRSLADVAKEMVGGQVNVKVQLQITLLVLIQNKASKVELNISLCRFDRDQLGFIAVKSSYTRC